MEVVRIQEESSERLSDLSEDAHDGRIGIIGAQKDLASMEMLVKALRHPEIYIIDVFFDMKDILLAEPLLQYGKDVISCNQMLRHASVDSFDKYR